MNKTIEKIIMFAAVAFTALVLWDSIAVLLLSADYITIYTAFGFALVLKLVEKLYKALM